MNNNTLKLLEEFNRYFTSSNDVDVPARINVSRDEWRQLYKNLKEQNTQPAEVTDEQIINIAAQWSNKEFAEGAWRFCTDFARAILALRPQQSGLTGCNCRWDGDTQVQWCELHLAHKEAIHEWAERAKEAEKQLALRPAAVPMTDKPIADAVAAEREACAQICDSMPYRVASARKASRAIRERGITAQAKKEGA